MVGLIKRKIHIYKICLSIISLMCLYNRSLAQSIDYEQAMNDIMDNYLSDYPEPTIKALDQLFAGVDISELPVWTSFLYYYYYGGCLAEIRPDDAIKYLVEARKIATTEQGIGVHNINAVDAEMILADIYMAMGTEESKAAALFLYNDIIVVGISLFTDPDYAHYVILSLIAQAEMGEKLWRDPEWVKKLWIQVRDFALELNDSTYYSYYVLNVLKYYCDLGDYDTALSFMEDAKNKEILEVDASSYCRYIQEVKTLLSQDEALKSSVGSRSMDYWKNKLRIATLATALCSDKKSLALLQEVEQGLVENQLTASYEYAQVLYLLSTNTVASLELAESYLVKQINLMETSPQFLVYAPDTDIFNQLGLCQMKQGKYNEAHGNFQKALACLERNSAISDLSDYKNFKGVLFHNIGRNLYFLGEYDASVEYLTESIAIQEKTNETVMPKSIVYLNESMECL